eukprot:4090485-Pleurochrysis_carterae.AAC.1
MVHCSVFAFLLQSTAAAKQLIDLFRSSPLTWLFKLSHGLRCITQIMLLQFAADAFRRTISEPLGQSAAKASSALAHTVLLFLPSFILTPSTHPSLSALPRPILSLNTSLLRIVSADTGAARLPPVWPDADDGGGAARVDEAVVDEARSTRRARRQRVRRAEEARRRVAKPA